MSTQSTGHIRDEECGMEALKGGWQKQVEDIWMLINHTGALAKETKDIGVKEWLSD